ncbi:2-succinyl-5-enolpyruvyl-6-hydroxy-3-cyclohexene-1-carboxylic-acid synthase [Algoriphagus sp. C2-6-M1]|uniref:2-succinyl-5-enolpyruvyl-6-hydroxy-3- cyclohexene-1-carboxylic-acid synthase n=1 Tax=Algoriphagus persicinus TaxID=3108754 RepID=UPI002B375E14|nr:2-succinyl-5-enolpyruvyl-6-hydroxy-3-cyclohexene-1-carboxylic-acid synthase [Algoriphagus sp. C2-6-M1]MEB2779944.1 2-succinyl-5-enolpyruvyl-6-hydroxy-3-cyclohexene-1-carboxylic-acid synthase [Algoriphagus sp. C2-6-M1]
MILPQITDLVAICAKKGIENAILSPGSRCAPLTLAFARHPQIHTRTISDERSAAFIALGMAQQLEQPVALVCTSGSAALNYYPAIAEAFFQQIPLLVLTADRPAEWIDQYDGQTIFQPDVYGKHVKGSFQLPDIASNPDQLWHSSRIVNEAINLAKQFPAGPVHINIPLREPFYPEKGETLIFPEKPRVFNLLKSKTQPTDESLIKLKNRLEIVQRILIIPGQQRPDLHIQALLDQLATHQKVVIVADTISNLQSDQTITLHDHWLGSQEFSNSLKPDLIISFGKSIISKSLKLFLRSTQASHWHIQSDGNAKDTYQRLTRNIATSPIFFLKWLVQNLGHQDTEYYQSWHSLEKCVSSNLSPILQREYFGEYPALAYCLNKIPTTSKIHVANSMAVRYLNMLGKRGQEVICNRGTSGIDGSNSTAVGCTFTTKDIVTLITGDMAFFYDRNAFWHNYTIPNLRVILLNNHAGGIFRLIDGPANQPELEEFFETKQTLTANHLATEFGFFYSKVVNQEELEASLEDFYEDSLHPKILEIETSSTKNSEILKEVKEKIKTELRSIN